MGEYQLTSEIVGRSVAKNWDQAKLEWRLSDVYFDDEPQTCLCGHYPIIEICVLANKLNGNSVDVGNCCVKKFIGLPSDKIFQAVKRVKKDVAKSLNAEAIEHANGKGWITEWEYKFYFDVMRKRILTAKQNTVKEKINRKILARITERR